MEIVNFVILILGIIATIIWIVSLANTKKGDRCIVDEKLCAECPFPCEEHMRREKSVE